MNELSKTLESVLTYHFIERPPVIRDHMLKYFVHLPVSNQFR